MIGGFAWEPLGTIRHRTFPLASALAMHGHDVRIFLPPYDNLRYSGQTFLREGVTVVNTAAYRSRAGLPLMLISLLRLVTKFRPDIVHVFKPKGFSGAAGMILRVLGVPIILDCDDWEGWGGWNDVMPYPRLVKDFIDFQERWLIRHAAAVTVASHALEGRALEVGAKGPVVLVPNCGASASQVPLQHEVAALDRADERGGFGIAVDRKVIFYAGHFEPADDLGFLCRVCAHVARRTGALLLFAGTGPRLAEVQAFMAEQGIEAKYLPPASYRDFLRAISISDVTVFPYPDDPLHRSKCSARIIDYMAMGKPVVTTAVGMNLEYIVDGESGVLVPADNEERFESELELLLDDPNRCTILGSQARHRIRTTFRWDGRPLTACLEIYDSVGKSREDA